MLQLFAVAPFHTNNSAIMRCYIRQTRKYMGSHCVAIYCSNNRQNSPNL